MKKPNLKGILSFLALCLMLAVPSKNLQAAEDTAHLTFQKPVIAKTDSAVYAVKKGDTLSGIVAKSLGSFSPAERRRIYQIIRTLNPNLVNYNRIYAGQKLRLPGKYVISSDKNFRISALQVSSGGVPVESALARKKTAWSLERSPLPVGYRMAFIREVIQRMNGTITTAGNYYIPLPQAGRVAIDCSRIPVVELPDGSSVLLDFTERAPVSLKSMIEAHWPNYRFVTANHQEDPEKVIQKAINASRSYTMTRSQKPLGVGDVPHLEISADWIIAEKATGGKTPYQQGITLIKSRSQALPENVKDYANRNGIVITELIDGIGVAASPAPKSNAPEVGVLGGATSISQCAALLKHLGYEPAENVDLDIFNRSRDGFDLAVKAELLVKKESGRVTFHSKDLPPQLIKTLKDNGIEMVVFGENDSRQTVIEKTLSAMKIPFSKGVFLYPLVADPAGNPRATISFPAVKMNRGESSLHFIDFAMDPALYQSLYNQGGDPAHPVLSVRAISLFSGGLDSILAVKLIGEQGIDIEGIAFETPFFNASRARLAAEKIGLSLRIIDLTHPHLVMLKSPRYGYGKNMNPCIDCHTLMLAKAGKIMEETGADFIFTGEVLGQRPMSQTRQSLHVVAKNSGYADFIVRPLSARLLPETRPEQEKKLDRSKLLSIQGRGRKMQIQLARHYGIVDYPPPAGGCLLTDPNFSRRLKDLFDHCPDHGIRDIELLKLGRHFRIHANAKLIVGRNQADNAAILALLREGDAVLQMADFRGPTVLVPNGCDEATLGAAAGFCCLYANRPDDNPCKVLCRTGGTARTMTATAPRREDAERMLL